MALSKKLGYGARIAQARKDAGFSQKALMEKLGWPNDSNSRLSGYENEEREPTLGDFIRIADACKADPAYIAFGVYRMDPEAQRVAVAFLNADEHNRSVVRAALQITGRNNQKKAAD